MTARLPRRIVLRGAVLAAVAGAGAWGALRGPRFAYAGTPVPGQPVIPLDLPDDTGGRFDLAAHRGGVVLVYFGYTHCPDVCPTTLVLIGNALRAMGKSARHVLPVFVTLDPGRDTPAVLAAYLGAFTPPPLGLTAPADAIAAAARAWDVHWRFTDGGQFIDHSSVVSAVGPDGHVRLRYGFSQMQDSHRVASDLRHLLAG